MEPFIRKDAAYASVWWYDHQIMTIRS